MKKQIFLFSILYLLLGFISYYIPYMNQTIIISYLYEIIKRTYILFVIALCTFFYTKINNISIKEICIFLISLVIILFIHIPFFKTSSEIIINYDIPTIFLLIIITTIGLLLKLYISRRNVIIKNTVLHKRYTVIPIIYLLYVLYYEIILFILLVNNISIYIYNLFQYSYLLFVIILIYNLFKTYRSICYNDLLIFNYLLLIILVLHLPYYNILCLGPIDFNIPILLIMMGITLGTGLMKLNSSHMK